MTASDMGEVADQLFSCYKVLSAKGVDISLNLWTEGGETFFRLSSSKPSKKDVHKGDRDMLQSTSLPQTSFFSSPTPSESVSHVKKPLSDGQTAPPTLPPLLTEPPCSPKRRGSRSNAQVSPHRPFPLLIEPVTPEHCPGNRRNVDLHQKSKKTREKFVFSPCKIALEKGPEYCALCCNIDIENKLKYMCSNDKTLYSPCGNEHWHRESAKCVRRES